jgi:hypothetical protein
MSWTSQPLCALSVRLRRSTKRYRSGSTGSNFRETPERRILHTCRDATDDITADSSVRRMWHVANQHVDGVHRREGSEHRRGTPAPKTGQAIAPCCRRRSRNGWSSAIRRLHPREHRHIPARGLWQQPQPTLCAELPMEASVGTSDGRNRGCPPCFPGLAKTVQAAGCRSLQVEGAPDVSGPTGRSRPADAPGLSGARGPRNFREPKWLMLPKADGLERAMTRVRPAVRASQGEEARK